MATCPKCGGYLSKHHRCWGGMRRLREGVLTLTGALVGFIAGLVLVDQPTPALLVVTALLGGVLALAIQRYARF